LLPWRFDMGVLIAPQLALMASVRRESRPSLIKATEVDSVGMIRRDLRPVICIAGSLLRQDNTNFGRGI